MSATSTATPATVEGLLLELEHRPLLWVGAGASVPAGFPTSGQLVQALVKAGGSDAGIGPDLPLPQAADAFVTARSGGELSELLQREIGTRPHKPTAFHLAVARLAQVGCFAGLVTTNYDDLLESTLRTQGVPCLVQSLEDNAEVRGGGEVRVIKLHGTATSWQEVILTGVSYETFKQRYDFLLGQLDQLLHHHSVLFVGCSFQDPRLLGWLSALDAEEIAQLHLWRPLMTEEAWQAALAFEWHGAPAGELLDRAPIKPLLLDNHAHLLELWSEAAARLAPEQERLDLNVVVGSEVLDLSLEGCERWQVADPLEDEELSELLEAFLRLGALSLPTDEHGAPAGEAAAVADRLRELAATLGDRLTEALLSAEARGRLATCVRSAPAGHPPFLVLRVRPAQPSAAGERRADRVLALPWELLRLEKRFPVEQGSLDLAREAVVAGKPGLEPPDRELSVVATVAAPVDADPFDYEDELYRLNIALHEHGEEGRLVTPDRGTLGDLLATLARHHPPAVHFSGHGKPGALLFEDETAHKSQVEVDDLIRRFQEQAIHPRLFYLSACHGSTATATTFSARPSERVADPVLRPLSQEPATSTPPSTAASLHRAGFPQVMAYFGPLGDTQATRIAAAFYAALASGERARQALRRARRVAAEPHLDGDCPTRVYPVGWTRLALYHRGEDQPTALASVRGAGRDPLAAERERRHQRLDRTGKTQLAERGLTGVQRLVQGFVGRRGPRAEAIRRWRSGERLLVVTGLGGLGKTALCTELAPILATHLGEEAEILALDGRHVGAQPHPVATLWTEVQAARDDKAWSTTLAELQREGLTGKALAQALEALAAAAGPLLVYLDDAESLQVEGGQKEVGRWQDGEIRSFWRELQRRTGPSLGLMASSRYRPEGTPEAALLRLPEMREPEMVRLLGWMPTLGRLPFAERRRLAKMLDGHPRTVEYLEPLARDQERKVVGPGGRYTGDDWWDEVIKPVLPEAVEKVEADLLLGRLIDSLPEAAQEHLGRCSVLTAPAPWGAVLALEPEDGSGERLVDAGLLTPFEGLEPRNRDPWWAPHRLVAEEVEHRWNGEPAEVHRALGRWYRKRTENKPALVWHMRSIQHLCLAGEGDEAWPLAHPMLVHLQKEARYREALGLVKQILAAEPTGPALGLAWTFRAQLSLLAGVPHPTAETDLAAAIDLVDEEDQALVLSAFGMLYQHQGRLSEAAKHLERSVDVEIRFRGEEHPSTAKSLVQLAALLHAQGDLLGARRHLERSLAILESVHGTTLHDEVATAMHELARVLHSQGDLSGAKQHLERSLVIMKAIHNTEEHLSVAASLHELGRVLHSQKDLSGARKCLERSLAIQASVRETDQHASVGASLHELGRVLHGQGDLPGARKCLERSLAIQTSVYGTSEHPDVASSLHELAGVLHTQGDVSGAKKKLEAALRIDKKIYAREHYFTALTEMDLGTLLLQEGSIKKGLKLLKHAHGVFRRQLGPDHPYTLQLRSLFARLRSPEER